jgi:hypothetical protein
LLACSLPFFKCMYAPKPQAFSFVLRSCRQYTVKYVSNRRSSCKPWWPRLGSPAVLRQRASSLDSCDSAEDFERCVSIIIARLTLPAIMLFFCNVSGTRGNALSFASSMPHYRVWRGCPAAYLSTRISGSCQSLDVFEELSGQQLRVQTYLKAFRNNEIGSMPTDML